MVAELSRVDAWLWETITADGALDQWADGGVWQDQAPQDARGKMVLIQWQGGSHRKLPASYALYLIRAAAEGESFDLVEEPADRIDAAVMGAVPVGGLNYRDIRIGGVQRDQPHQRKDSENGIPVVYLGNVYRVLFTNPTPA